MPTTIPGACLCGTGDRNGRAGVLGRHDHSGSSRRAHGAAVAMYVGGRESKVRVVRGEGVLSRFEDVERRRAPTFCLRYGTPVMLALGGSLKMINIPRAPFSACTGREAKHHVAIEQLQEWPCPGGPSGPLKGYPDVSIASREDLFET